jgi:hypothetical protein
MLCNNCVFFNEIGESGRGHCHRHAPVVAVMKFEGADPEAFTLWPKTDRSLGCGDGEDCRDPDDIADDLAGES